MDLVYKNEKPLFIIAAVISTIFWLVLTVATIGVVLIYLLLGYLFFLFAHSAFISYLKGTGVKISDEQYPDLYEKLVRGCATVGLKEVPEAYLLRTDFFNAIATKFLGKHFVVLFTDVVDALDSQPGAIDFYIGHELGHIHRRHLSWSTFIWPASVLPLLGAALRRAEEYTCDRYGVACCQSEDDIKAAISAIAAGDTRWKSININSYLKQVSYTRGFWMSFNELTSDYPWLTKRMATSLAVSRGEKIKCPRRNIFAWALACVIPRFGVNGAGSLLVVVAVIGILAAVALPAYQDYTERARIAGAYTSAKQVQAKVTQYVANHEAWPQSMQVLGYNEDALVDHANNVSVSLYDEGMIGALVGVDYAGDEQYLVLEPEVIDEGIVWHCYGENLLAKSLPAACR
ncbi:M48 family metalloprotease [Gilvimarinus polysaccharolyticus]|uniref:M48 family metalloprotease n=1 Tax=Gilvimarinus polysaccharolyticus TaxID=863921 RepID=UPI000673A12E|nr:M48 family metalloprotease [Gilvimarinus polysaccharolyticus]